MVLDYIALAIMVLLILLAVWVILKLGALPGKIAEKRGHPQFEAIRVAGWVGILTMGVFWPLALIWAYTVTGEMSLPAEEQTRAETLVDEPEGDETEEAELKEEKA